MTRKRVCAALAAIYTLAATLTGCHHPPTTYHTPITTWATQ